MLNKAEAMASDYIGLVQCINARKYKIAIITQDFYYKEQKMKLKWIETYNGFLIKVEHISSLSFSTFESNTKGVSESIILVRLFNGNCYHLKKYNHNMEYIDNNEVTYSAKEAIESDFDRIKECLTTNLLKISFFDKSMYLKELS